MRTWRFGDLKFHLAEKDFWFLAKAVPRIHQNIYQEISTLAFILQEATPVNGEDDGSRIGLDEQGILALLKRVIRLKIDTLSLLADYQIDRSRKALRRSPRKPRTEQKKKPIISEKMQAEDEKKLEKERKQAKSWGFASARNRGLSGKGGPRRPRFPPFKSNYTERQFTSVNRNTGSVSPTFKVSFKGNGKGNDRRSNHKGGLNINNNKKKSFPRPQQSKKFQPKPRSAMQRF